MGSRREIDVLVREVERDPLHLAVVIGDRKKYLSALLTLKTEPDVAGNPTFVLEPWIRKRFGVQTVTDASSDPIITKYLDSGLSEVNRNVPSNAQTIKRWVILPNDFSIDSGELTSTMKLKRNVIYQKYQSEIESLY